jgi:hypothetical protein
MRSPLDVQSPGRSYDVLTTNFKVIRTHSGMDMDLLDPGFYNAKLVNSSRSIEGLQEDNII